MVQKGQEVEVEVEVEGGWGEVILVWEERSGERKM